MNGVMDVGGRMIARPLAQVRRAIRSNTGTGDHVGSELLMEMGVRMFVGGAEGDAGGRGQRHPSADDAGSGGRSYLCGGGGGVADKSEGGRHSGGWGGKDG